MADDDRDPPDVRGLTRRAFVAASLAAGFAAAVAPEVGHATVTTDADGLEAGAVEIPTAGDEKTPAYRAVPNGADRRPIVLVVQEIFGVHEHIRDVCRRLAKRGYFAVATELFARQGDVSKMTDVQEIVSKVVAKVPDDQVMKDLDATVDWAVKSGRADVAKLGITGFCWGGRIVWLYAAHSARLKAGVAWYGRLATPPDALHPKGPLDVAARLKAPVLGLYGGADTGIPMKDVEAMRSALAAAKSPSEIVVYPEAGHAFFADYRPSYRPDDAADGWKRMLAWLERFGVA
ncbi:MAG TPA: dienelactone hydrolase family protein [Candidatus Binatia bacterium]|nr:dienelactone hydrolase family protein [Candidatus Binatia bacterium]